YPEMMNDPPTIMGIVSLPEAGGDIALRLVYQSPTQRGELSLPRVYLGDRMGLFSRSFITDGFSFLFSLLLTFLGVLILLLSIAFLRKVASGRAFLWLGLFSLATGVWGLGECDLSAYFIPYPTLLYHMAYLGLFCTTLTFLNFGLLILQPRNPGPLVAMLAVNYVSLIAAILLQLTGVMDFTLSLYWFHLLAATGFVTFAVCLIWESVHHHNPASRQFGPAVLLLSAAVVIEVLNYWLHFINYFTLFFQLGVLAFVIALGIAGGHYVRASMLAGAEKAYLEQEMEQAGQLLILYKRQYESMTRADLEVRRQRHDLRHQLTVLRDLNRRSESQQLERYLSELTDALPGNPELRLCENPAVNAVAAHYVATARGQGIAADVQLQIPSDTGVLQEIDLCIIVGNLLENAVEACSRVRKGEKTLRLQGSLGQGGLRITCENCYAGEVNEFNGAFLSSKHPGEGMGIRSIRTVVEKYGGITRFEPGEDVFLSLVFVRIDRRNPTGDSA
ncbi:MAG: GHKL domain-containing protein, partial [Eubacteriales bacterium]|nr:GHKL domain-containing protein [Eubacteriales bacterium]